MAPPEPTADVLAIALLTLRVGLLSTAFILLPGVALGWLLARCEFRGRAFVQTLVALPMVLPPVAVGLALLLLLSRRFAFGRALEDLFGGPILLTWWAAALASRLTVFRRVTLPLAARGILYGVVFAFARGLGEFGATTLVAGNIPGRTETLALGMYARIESFRDADALALAGISVALAFGITWSAELFLCRNSERGPGAPASPAAGARATAPTGAAPARNASAGEPPR